LNDEIYEKGGQVSSKKSFGDSMFFFYLIIKQQVKELLTSETQTA
jgi:hypothetical protein